MVTDKEHIIAVRNGLFAAGDGKPLDCFMRGSIMAQTKIAVEAAETQERAIEILMFYFNIAINAVPTYWATRSPATQTGRA